MPSLADVTTVVTGEKARNIMESLSANFTLENGDGEWSGKTLSIKTGIILCSYTALYPDEWMTNVKCYENSIGPALNQSLSLAKALQEFANSDSGTGNRWLSVESLQCFLKYDELVYTCELITK